MIVPNGDIKDMTIPWLFQGLRKEKQGVAWRFRQINNRDAGQQALTALIHSDAERRE